MTDYMKLIVREAKKEKLRHPDNFCAGLIIGHGKTGASSYAMEIPAKETGMREAAAERMRTLIASHPGWRWYVFVTDCFATLVDTKTGKETKYEALTFLEGTREGEQLHVLPYEATEEGIRWKKLIHGNGKDHSLEGTFTRLANSPAKSGICMENPPSPN